MLPQVVRENSVKIFNFHGAGQRYQAISHDGKIYRLTEVFKDTARIHAHALGCRLTNRAIDTVITVSATGVHKVWAEIRSQTPLAPLAIEEINEPQLSRTLLVSE